MLITLGGVISYFFCKHDEAESLKARTIIVSIARQLFSCVNMEVIDRVDPLNSSFLNTDKGSGISPDVASFRPSGIGGTP